MSKRRTRVVLFANSDWYLFNFRLALAKRLVAEGYDVVLISPPGAFGDLLRGEGLEWQPAPMTRRSLNPFREVMLLCWLRRFFVNQKVDVVHSFTIKCAIYGSLAALTCPRRVARINAVAGMGYVFTSDDLKARLLRPIIRRLFKVFTYGGGSRLVVQNLADAQYFSALGVPEEILRLIPGSGVDCSEFTPSGRRNGGSEISVLFPARLLWDKGLSEFVQAARVLKAKGVRFDFILAGAPDPGNPSSAPPERLEAWIAEGVVRWLGHVKNMSSVYREVDVVVLPSYREGLPKSLIEAGACGLPVVTTDVPGCRDVVEDGVSGLLVPPRDAKALATAIERLLEPGLRSTLGSNLQAKVLSNFEQEVILESTLTLYHDLL